MPKKIFIKYKKKRISIAVKDCSLLGKTLGLMFSQRENTEILMFSFRKKQKIKIHSFFVFYPFIAIWIDGKSNIMDMKIVKPFSLCVSPKRKALRLIEIPINRKNKKYIKLFSPSMIRKI